MACCACCCENKSPPGVCCGVGEERACCQQPSTCCQEKVCCTETEACCGSPSYPVCCPAGEYCCDDDVCKECCGSVDCPEGQNCCEGVCQEEPCGCDCACDIAFNNVSPCESLTEDSSGVVDGVDWRCYRGLSSFISAAYYDAGVPILENLFDCIFEDAGLGDNIGDAFVEGAVEAVTGCRIVVEYAIKETSDGEDGDVYERYTIYKKNCSTGDLEAITDQVVAEQGGWTYDGGSLVKHTLYGAGAAWPTGVSCSWDNQAACDDPGPLSVAPPVVLSEEFPKPTLGPGTELKALLAKVGIKASSGCSCNKRAKLMDENEAREPGWCAANIETICDWLAEESAKRKLPFVRLAGKALIKAAIRRAKKKGNSK